MMKRVFALAATFVFAATAAAPARAGSGRFDWTTKSAEARKRLADLQARIENFQFGPETVAAAEKLVAADPAFAMGVYYLSAVAPPPDNQKHLDRAVELSRKASDAERRFIDAMVVARANQGANFKDAIPALEKLSAEYPKERLVQVILGQMYQGASQPDKARAAFDAAERIGPPSPRVRAFLANDDLIKGDYEKARHTFLEVEKSLPKGSAPFAVRYGLTFAYLYEGKVEAAVDSLKTYLAEYKDSGSAQGFPEVFIWNSIARIHLENGRLEEAMKAYESGYESVPGSSLPEDQKQICLGRGAAGQEDDRRRRRAGEAGPPRLPLPGRLPEAGGGRLPGRGGRAEAGERPGPVPHPAPRPGLREARGQGERAKGLSGGAGLAAERTRASPRLPGGEAQARGLRVFPS